MNMEQLGKSELAGKTCPSVTLSTTRATLGPVWNPCRSCGSVTGHAYLCFHHYTRTNIDLELVYVNNKVKFNAFHTICIPESFRKHMYTIRKSLQYKYFDESVLLNSYYGENNVIFPVTSSIVQKS
jgi:hypothetical protein